MNAQMQTLWTAARNAASQGNRGGQRQALEQILAIEPSNPQALNSMGIVAEAEGDYAAAQDYYARAAELDPKEPALWMNLAKAQRLAGEEVAELASLNRVLAIDQRHFMGRIRKAEWHERRGEDAKALADWTAVVQLAAGLDRASHPGLTPLLEHANAFIAARAAVFEQTVTDHITASRQDKAPDSLRRFDAAMAASLGKRKIYHNECAGLYYPFLPTDEFFARHHFPWMAELEEKSAAIRGELEALLDAGGDGFAPYVNMPAGTPANKWSELDGSHRWDACYLWKYGERKEAVAAKCPATIAALEAIPAFHAPRRGPTAFFSLLRPGSHIPPHTGVSNTRSIVHLPLIIPENCAFRVGGETREWREGQAFVFDDTIEHEAWNRSEALRAVLIFDVWNPYIGEEERELLCAYWDAANASGLGPDDAETPF